MIGQCSCQTFAANQIKVRALSSHSDWLGIQNRVPTLLFLKRSQTKNRANHHKLFFGVIRVGKNQNREFLVCIITYRYRRYRNFTVWFHEVQKPKLFSIEDVLLLICRNLLTKYGKVSLNSFSITVTCFSVRSKRLPLSNAF